MSIEQLLFFLLLVAFPLLEQFFRARRARTERAQARRPVAAPKVAVPRPATPASVPGAGADAEREVVAPLPLPESSRRPAPPQTVGSAEPEQFLPSEGKPQMRRERKHGSPKSAREGYANRPMAVRRVIAAGDLRRAIVLMTILGPCRALEQKDTSQPG
jgi:hypothetical protein